MARKRDRLQTAGEWLAAARGQAHLTQKQLAALLGISGAHVSNYERGISAFPDDQTKRLADALGRDELDVRRGLGMYVPGDLDQYVDVPAAILRDPHLIPEARQHLLNQYQLLLRIHSSPEQEAEKQRQEAEIQARGKAILDEVARRRDATRKGGGRPPRPPSS